MRTNGIHVTVGAALLTVATAIAPATAEVVEPVPAGTTTMVRTDCVGGHGTLAMKQVRLASGATRVVLTGTDVRNGRWRGGFAPDTSSDDGGVDLEATAVRREFRTVLKVPEVSPDTNATLVQRFDRACAVGLTARPRTTAVYGATAALVARHATTGELTARGIVAGCRNGSRWRYTASAEFANAGVGWQRSGLLCRDHMVRIPRTTISGSGIDQAQATALRLVARSADGAVRRLAYRLSAPGA